MHRYELNVDTWKSSTKSIIESIGRCSVSNLRIDSMNEFETMSMAFYIRFHCMERFRFDVSQPISIDTTLPTQEIQEVGIRINISDETISHARMDCMHDFNGYFFSRYIAPMLQDELYKFFRKTDYKSPPRNVYKRNNKIRKIRL